MLFEYQQLLTKSDNKLKLILTTINWKKKLNIVANNVFQLSLIFIASGVKANFFFTQKKKNSNFSNEIS